MGIRRLCLVVAGVGLFTGCGGGAVDPIVLDEPFDQVVLEVDSGSIFVQTSADQTASVSRTVDKGQGATELAWDLRDGTLYLDAMCYRNNPLKCEVVHELELPAGVAIDVSLGGGQLDLYAVDGPVSVALGTGDVQASYLRSSQAWLTVGEGSVILEYADRPGEVDVSLGVGRLDLVVPQGSYAASLDVGLGELDVYGILEDPESDASLRGAVGEGELSVFGF